MLIVQDAHWHIKACADHCGNNKARILIVVSYSILEVLKVSFVCSAYCDRDKEPL